MEHERIIAIGDIHGCLDKLEDLLQKVGVVQAKDLLVFLGDYIDRGPDPRGVIELVSGMKASSPRRVRCLMGNHERMFLDYIEGRDQGQFLMNGGEKTIASYYEPGKGLSIPERHMNFLTSLEPFFETDTHIFVHAGLRPGVPLERQKEEDLLWSRSAFIVSLHDWGKTVVFGHTHFETPFVMKNKIGIDTGAVYGGPLTALILPDMTFISTS